MDRALAPGMEVDDDYMGALISKHFLEVAERELIHGPPVPGEEIIASCFPGMSPEEVERHCHAVFKTYEATALGVPPSAAVVSDRRRQVDAAELQYYCAHHPAALFKNRVGVGGLFGLFPSTTLAYVSHAVSPFDSFAGGQEPPPIIAAEPSRRQRIAALREGLPDRSSTNGLIWSREEHELFLLGMECFGRGDWKNIAKYFVLSRTSTQIASHAQKFFTRRCKMQSAADQPAAGLTSRPSIHDLSIVRPAEHGHQTPPQHYYPPPFAQNIGHFYHGEGSAVADFNGRFSISDFPVITTGGGDDENSGNSTAHHMYQCYSWQPAADDQRRPQQYLPTVTAGHHPGDQSTEELSTDYLLELLISGSDEDEFEGLEDIIMQGLDYL